MSVLDKVRQMFGQTKEKATGDGGETGSAEPKPTAESATEAADAKMATEVAEDKGADPKS